MVDEGAIVVIAGARDSRWIFGHAIYEHAYAGDDAAIRGCAIDLDVPGVDELGPVDARAAVDRAMAAVDLASAVRDGPGIPLGDQNL